MGEYSIVLRRDNAAPLAALRAELDGLDAGNLKAGKTLTLATTEGQHTITLFSGRKAQKTAQILVESTKPVVNIVVSWGMQGVTMKTVEAHAKKKNPAVMVISAVFKTLAVLLVAFIAFGVFMNIVTREPANQTGEEPPAQQADDGAASEPPVDAEPAQQDTDRVLYDGDLMKATLKRIYHDATSDALTAFYVQIEFENKSDRDVLFFLHDVAVNDFNIFPMGGNPIGTKPGEKSATPFALGYANLGINGYDDIYSVKFALQMVDEEHISEILVETERYEAVP